MKTNYIFHFLLVLALQLTLVFQASAQGWGGWLFGQAGPTYQRIKVTGSVENTTTIFDPTSSPYDTTVTDLIDEQRGLLRLFFYYLPCDLSLYR